MTIRPAWPSRRSDREAGAQAQMRRALSPVSDALRELADATAARELHDAAGHCDAVVEAARVDAARLLEAARQEGREAGERQRARELALARREARELVLAAQGRAFESLRVAALDALVAQATSPAAQDLARLIERTVCARASAPTATHPEALGALGAAAEAGDRRATLGTMALIDLEIERMAGSIATLWT